MAGESWRDIPSGRSDPGGSPDQRADDSDDGGSGGSNGSDGLDDWGGEPGSGGSSGRSDSGSSPNQRSSGGSSSSGGLDDWGGEPGSGGDPTPDSGGGSDLDDWEGEPGSGGPGDAPETGRDDSPPSGRTDPGVSPDQRSSSGSSSSGGLDNWGGEPGSGGDPTPDSDGREDSMADVTQAATSGARGTDAAAARRAAAAASMTSGLEDEPTQRQGVNELQRRLREEEGLMRWQYDIREEDGMLRADIADSVQRRRARRQAAEQFGEDVAAEDVTVTEAGDGAFEATLTEGAQRELAADQISEETGIPESQFDVKRTDEGFEPVFGDQAADEGMWSHVGEALGERAVRQRVAEEEGVDVENINVEQTESGYDVSLEVDVGRTDPGVTPTTPSEQGSGGTTGNITGIETGGDASAPAEQFGDIDWSAGLGGSEDEVENFIDSLRPRAEAAVAPRLEEGSFVEQYGVEAQPAETPSEELARRTASDAAVGLATAPAVLAQDIGEAATEGAELGVDLLAQDAPPDEAAVPERYATQYGTGEAARELDRAADEGVARVEQGVQFFSENPSELGGLAAVTAVSAPLSIAATSRVPGLGSDISGRIIQSGGERVRRAAAGTREFARAERGQADLTGPTFGDETPTITAEDLDVERVTPEEGARRRPPREDVGDIDPGGPLARRRERARNPEPDRGRDIAFRRSLSDDARRWRGESPTQSGELIDETGSVRDLDTFDPMAEGLAASGPMAATAASEGLAAAGESDMLAADADLRSDLASGARSDTDVLADVDARQDVSTRVEGRLDTRVDVDTRLDVGTRMDTRQDIRTDVGTRQDVRQDMRTDLEARTDLRTDSEMDLSPERRRRGGATGSGGQFDKIFESDVAAPGDVLSGDGT